MHTQMLGNTLTLEIIATKNKLAVHGDVVHLASAKAINKQVLQADALLQTEKMLFVHFFTEPDRSSRIVSDLAKRVDSIALANQ